MFAKIFVALLALVAFASSQVVNVPFTACTGGVNPPNWIQSSQCNAAGTCFLTRGTHFTARAEFTAREAHQTLNIFLSATLLGINFPLSIAPGYENACPQLEAPVSCPIATGVTAVWGLQIPINVSYPAVSGLNIRVAAGEISTRLAACGHVIGSIV